MASWLCYLIGAEYLVAAVFKLSEAKSENDVWLGTMLLMYAVASVALGKIT